MMPGIGRFTFMSALDSGLINYVIASQEWFPLIRDFVVYDIHVFTFLPHMPIQVNLNVNYERNYCSEEHFETKIILWDDSKADSFKNILSAKTHQLSNIVDGINLPIWN